MNEPNTPSEVPAANPNVSTKDMGDGVILKLESIDGEKIKGHSFWRVTFKDAASAVNHFTKHSKGGKTGEEVVVGIVNSQLSFRMRSQANQAILAKARELLDDKEGKIADLSDEDVATLRQKFPTLITEDEALDYVPGEREVDALSGLRKQKDELRKMAAKLKSEGKIDLAREKLTQYFEIDKRIKEKEAAEEASLLELIK